MTANTPMVEGPITLQNRHSDHSNRVGTQVGESTSKKSLASAWSREPEDGASPGETPKLG